MGEPKHRVLWALRAHLTRGAFGLHTLLELDDEYWIMLVREAESFGHCLLEVGENSNRKCGGSHTRENRARGLPRVIALSRGRASVLLYDTVIRW